MAEDEWLCLTEINNEENEEFAIGGTTLSANIVARVNCNPGFLGNRELGLVKVDS